MSAIFVDAFDLLWTSSLIFLKVVGLLIFSYVFYWKVIDYAHGMWFYTR